MKKLLTLAVLLCATVSQAQVSYWFSQWQRRGDAADVQDFFMWPGTNIAFSYASNHVIINGTGGGGGGGATNCSDCTNFYNAIYYPLVANPAAYLTANQPITLTGDITGGPAATSIATTLANVGAGGVDSTKVTWNTKGLVTAGGPAILASADFIGQGDTNDVLHGNIAGENPYWGPVDLANDVSGNLAVGNLAGGAGAGVGTFWQGDGTWAVPAGGGGGDIPYTSVTNAPWQWGCANLTNLCLYANFNATGTINYAGVGANGTLSGVGIGAYANAANNGAALGHSALGWYYGAAVGVNSKATNNGVAVGNTAYGSDHGVAIGAFAEANGIGNVAIGGAEWNGGAPNRAQVPNGWQNTIELGQGTAVLQGALHYRGRPIMNSSYVFTGNGNLLTNIPGPAITGLLPTASWQGSTNVWELDGNALGGTGPFIGSTDNEPFEMRVNNTQVGLLNTNLSVAFGINAQATAPMSIAVGTNSLASADYAIALGREALASELNSVAIGTIAKATAWSAVAIGQSSEATAIGAVGIGSGKANGTYSFCSGLNCVTTGQYSTAIGYSSQAIGNYSAAIGHSCIAHSDYSFAFGWESEAINQGSFVFADSSGFPPTDTGQNQWVSTFSGGYYLYGYGSTFNVMDGPAKFYGNTNWFSGQTTVGNILRVATVANKMTGTDGYPTTTTNIVAGFTPVGLFGYMGWYGTATVDLATVGAYTNVWVASGTVPSRVLTNGFGYNATTCQLTNHIAGYYKADLQLCLLGTGGLADDLEVELVVTPAGTATPIHDELISSYTTQPGVAKAFELNAKGIIYLAAGSRVEIQLVNDDGARDYDMVRASLSLTTP